MRNQRHYFCQSSYPALRPYSALRWAGAKVRLIFHWAKFSPIIVTFSSLWYLSHRGGPREGIDETADIDNRCI